MKIDVQEFFTQVMSARTISPQEKKMVTALLKQGNLDDNERALVKRLYYGVEHGLLQVAE